MDYFAIHRSPDQQIEAAVDSEGGNEEVDITPTGTQRTEFRHAFIAILACNFGLLEFASDWPWRTPGQVFIAMLAVLCSPRSATTPRLAVRFAFIAMSLLVAGWRAHSISLGALGVVAAFALIAPVGRARSRSLTQFVLGGTATIGVTCAYLHGPVIWEWPRLLAGIGATLQRLGRLNGAIPTLLSTGELVLRGQPIHVSTLSVFWAIPVIATMLAWRRMSPWMSLLVGALSVVAAVALNSTATLIAVGSGRIDWVVHPALIGCYVTVVGAVVFFLSCRVASSDANEPLPVFALLGSVLSGAALWALITPGSLAAPRHLRIVVDDAHGQWERTDVPYNSKNYGRDTVYTYSLLRDWLDRRHDVVVQNVAPLRPSGDVLIIKTPALPYSTSEAATIGTFVRSGGGLIVIGDHTNLFGTTGHVNALLEPVGVRFRDDAAIPFAGITRRFSPSWWNGSPVFPQGGSFDFETSATIAATNWRALPLSVDFGVLAEAAEYSNERNFGDLRPSIDDRFPPLVSAAVVPWGKGRVVLLADSTPWSNFAFFSPGTKEALDRVINYAAAPQRRHTSLLMCLVAIGLLPAFLRPTMLLPALIHLFFVYGVLSAVFAPAMSSYRPTPLRDGVRPERRLVVDASHSHFRWDTDIRTDTGVDRDTQTAFFAWASRIGIAPEFRYADAYDDPDLPVLVLNPTLPFDPAEKSTIDRYVRLGGRLMVLDDPRERLASTAPEVLGRFGITYQPQTTAYGIYYAGGPMLPDLVWALPLSLLNDARRMPDRVVANYAGFEFTLLGVSPILVDGDGLVIYGKKTIGQGRVHSFIRSSVFSQAVMGDVWGGIEPGVASEQIYAMEYAMLSDLYPDLAGRASSQGTGQR